MFVYGTKIISKFNTYQAYSGTGKDPPFFSHSIKSMAFCFRDSLIDSHKLG